MIVLNHLSDPEHIWYRHSLEPVRPVLIWLWSKSGFNWTGYIVNWLLFDFDPMIQFRHINREVTSMANAKRFKLYIIKYEVTRKICLKMKRKNIVVPGQLCPKSFFWLGVAFVWKLKAKIIFIKGWLPLE